MESISRIGTASITTRFDGTLRNPRRRWTEKHVLLVFVETEGGLRGVGEAWLGSGTPGPVEAMIHHELSERMLGQPAWAIERLWRSLLGGASGTGRADQLYAAASGLDMALWDVRAQELGQPLYRLLGGHSDRAPVYASGGMYGPTPDELAEEARQAVRQGAAGFKIKGGGASRKEDFARAAAVRSAIGPQARLMVDLMFVPDFPEAMRLARGFAEMDLHFLESPTAMEDPEGWAAIHASSGVPLSGPEIAASERIHRDFLALGAAQILQFDLALCGGLTAGRRLAGLASSWNRTFALHCAGSAVVFAASAHLGAALPNVDAVERHQLHRSLFDRLEAAGYQFREGCVVASERPGLGLADQLSDLDTMRWTTRESTAS